MVFASIGRNSRCISGAKLTSQPLTEASLLYLGSCLDAFGAAGAEICRRLGEANGQLDKLARAWLAAFHTAHQTKDPFF